MTFVITKTKKTCVFMKTDIDTNMWLEYHYPLTIITDRYGGVYSGGEYLAFPNYYHDIPSNGPEGCDGDCIYFWSSYDGFCGLGVTPQEAYNDLIHNIENGIKYGEK